MKNRAGKSLKWILGGLAPLANPKSKGCSRALYFYVLFSGPADAITEIRRQLSINKNVLYFHQEKLPEKETPENHIQKFLQNLEQTAQKEKERITKNQKRQFGQTKFKSLTVEEKA